MEAQLCEFLDPYPPGRDRHDIARSTGVLFG